LSCFHSSMPYIQSSTEFHCVWCISSCNIMSWFCSSAWCVPLSASVSLLCTHRCSAAAVLAALHDEWCYTTQSYCVQHATPRHCSIRWLGQCTPCSALAAGTACAAQASSKLLVW
jgi:hypothetical protein